MSRWTRCKEWISNAWDYICSVYELVFGMKIVGHGLVLMILLELVIHVGCIKGKLLDFSQCQIVSSARFDYFSN